jgi:hypothetical protein
MDFFLKVSRMAEKWKIPKRHLLKYIKSRTRLTFCLQFSNGNRTHDFNILKDGALEFSIFLPF